MIEGLRLANGGRIDRTSCAALHLRRPPVWRLRRRYTRLGAARQRRAPHGSLVQVPPAARRAGRRCRGAQRAGRGAPRRSALHAEPARHAGRAVRGSRGAQPEPLADTVLRYRRRQRPARAVHPGGLLLQNVHVAERRLEVALRAAHPRGGGLRKGAHAGRSGSLRHALRALRRAGGRRRSGRSGRGRRGRGRRGAGHAVR